MSLLPKCSPIRRDVVNKLILKQREHLNLVWKFHFRSDPVNGKKKNIKKTSASPSGQVEAKLSLDSFERKFLYLN